MTLRDLQHFPDLPTSRDLTDFYLLALAIEHEAQLATLDPRFNSAALRGGPAALFIVP